MNTFTPDLDLPYIDHEFNIAFQIGKATFGVNSHRKLFKIMKIKKIKEIEVYMQYPDLGLCRTLFKTMSNGTIGMFGRYKIE